MDQSKIFLSCNCHQSIAIAHSITQKLTIEWNEYYQREEGEKEW